MITLKLISRYLNVNSIFKTTLRTSNTILRNNFDTYYVRQRVWINYVLSNIYKYNSNIHYSNTCFKNSRKYYISSFIPSVIAAKRKFNEDHYDAFFDAILRNDLATLKRLVEAGLDVNKRHKLGWNALHIASVNGLSDIAKYLLTKGADPNLGDDFQNIRTTAQKMRMHTLQVLVQREQEFCNRLSNNESFQGFTSLHYAVLNDDPYLIDTLLLAGADPTLTDKAGRTPVEYVKSTETASILHSAIERIDELKEQELAEERRLYPLELRLKENIVGQHSAINTISASIRRRENGWIDRDHPLVFLFLGSSGIGKTELAKQLNKYLHKDNDKGFIRLDMSEYQERHEVAKFIGSPPGYVGHEQGGQLTTRLRQCPSAVVLFDEVDKAHTDVLTILLQLFDEGRLTDGKGQTIDCRDAIFIMTSNLANNEIAEHSQNLRRDAKLTKDARSIKDINSQGKLLKDKIEISTRFREQIVRPILKRHFKRDEFLGRINEIVYFVTFSNEELSQLVTKELNMWKKQAGDKHNMEVTWDDEVIGMLIKGYNVYYGARSIKHEVERSVVSILALAHEQKIITPSCKVHIKLANSDKDCGYIKLVITDVNNEVKEFIDDDIDFIY